ncbi:energy-coupling factor ABC transporter ATP-binding protein [Desulfosediminicola ganghwensis]|uniref:energy-coupling factor ABC transporter ATP-binding protein n=1 Tax=Desulfosediminicola ganghwensis TaxID=2569540 RepID=UPI0010AD632A|nr:ABC transporter ATP-binding protein [Desulfosediminicola ganghwensis]
MDIRIDHLSFDYPGSIRALQDVSLEIQSGERVVLMGHNGSGKSTLAKHLNGLFRPLTGTVWLGGKNSATAEVGQLAGQVALLFQNPDDQICKRTIWNEVAFGPRNLGYPAERIEALVEEALALFELTTFKNKNPHDFGYSERKRIAMASIVAMDTPILVFDEPTAGLDYYEITLFSNALLKLQNEGKTVIVIAHDMDFVAENCSRAISLTDGKVVFDGNVRELFKHLELMTDCGILQPQVVQLSNACGLSLPALSPREFIAELEKQLT